MLTNEELKTLADTIEYLSMLRGSKALYFSDELDKIYYRIINERKKNSERVNNYNKSNKKYHNLINQLCYHRKMGNQDKVREIKSKLERLKQNV